MMFGIISIQPGPISRCGRVWIWIINLVDSAVLKDDRPQLVIVLTIRIEVRSLISPKVATILLVVDSGLFFLDCYNKISLSSLVCIANNSTLVMWNWIIYNSVKFWSWCERVLWKDSAQPNCNLCMRSLAIGAATFLLIWCCAQVHVISWCL